MENARRRVLQMLAEGRINVEEADELLGALYGQSAGAGGAKGERSAYRWGDIEFDIEGLGERIHQTVMRGLERVEQELRDLDVRIKREDWPRHWRMGGRARAGRTQDRPDDSEPSKGTSDDGSSRPDVL
jgi:hypothetical protein